MLQRAESPAVSCQMQSVLTPREGVQLRQCHSPQECVHDMSGILCSIGKTKPGDFPSISGHGSRPAEHHPSCTPKVSWIGWCINQTANGQPPYL